MTESNVQKLTSVSSRLAEKFGVDPLKLIQTLKQTAFRQSDGNEVTDVQMMALMMVADQYGLNPFTREIFAFPDKKGGGIVPVVGVDGWSRIANQHPQYDGVSFIYSDDWVTPEGGKECPKWIECRITRKDRKEPICIKEFLDETYQLPKKCNGEYGTYFVNGPWQSTTKRQLRHKSFIQCCRIALSFTGIYDLDEAERIIEGEVVSGDENDLKMNQSVPLQLTAETKEILTPILDELVRRSINLKSFAPSYQYVKERYVGAEYEFAIQYLRDAELEQMEPPEIDYSLVQAQDGIEDVLTGSTEDILQSAQH